MYSILLIIPSWFLYHFIEYSLHLLSHNYKYGGYIYNIHKKHHTIHYPPSQLISPPPYKTNYYYHFISEGLLAHGPPFFIICLLISFTMNTSFSLILISYLFLFAFISDYIHTQIHLSGSYLEKYQWFQNIRQLHLLHHIKTSKNINIMNHSIDKINHSYISNGVESISNPQ